MNERWVDRLYKWGMILCMLALLAAFITPNLAIPFVFAAVGCFIAMMLVS